MRTIILILTLLQFSVSLVAQEKPNPSDTVFNGTVVSSDWIDKGISLGVNFPNKLYGEVGYYKSGVLEVGGLPTVSTTMNYSMEFSHIDRFILAPKIQGRLHIYFFTTSLSALYYTDFKGGKTVRLRPEIGIGLFNLDINYGYNVNLYKDGIHQHNRHMLTVRCYLKLKRKPIGEYDRNGNKRPD